LSLPDDLVKPLEFDEPSLDLDQFFESENPLLPLPLKVPLVPFDFLKLGVNDAPFPFLYVLLELFVFGVREEVERDKEFLKASFCKAIIDKYLPVCQLVIKSARSEPFSSPPMYMYTAALMSMDFFHHPYEVVNSCV